MDGSDLIAYLDSAELHQCASNSSRLIIKLKTAIQDEQLYETQQIIRTVYFRFIHSNEKLSALENLLYFGASYLLGKGENVSGQDIATLYLEAVCKCLRRNHDASDTKTLHHLLQDMSMSEHEKQKTFDYQACQRVSSLILLLPDSELGRPRYLGETLKILSPGVINQDLLHNVIAEGFLKQKVYASCRYHYLHCANRENALHVGKFLAEYQVANKSDVELFLVQFILQFLCLQAPRLISSRSATTKSNLSPRSAADIALVSQEIFSGYTTNQPILKQASIPFSSYPLLNFIYSTITQLKSGDAQGFQMLCNLHKDALARDGSNKNYLKRIGTVYFGIVDPATTHRQGGLLNNILMSLLDGGEDEDESNKQASNNMLSCDDLD